MFDIGKQPKSPMFLSADGIEHFVKTPEFCPFLTNLHGGSSANELSLRSTHRVRFDRLLAGPHRWLCSQSGNTRNLTTPLSKDDTAGIMGVDLSRHGLPCRYGHGCRATFDPLRQDSEKELAVAAVQRNVHEVDTHGYFHVPQRQVSWSYTAKTSARGRSLLGK